MADLVIRGMEMPETCGLCQLCLDDSRICNGYCMFFHRRVNMMERDKNCPLLPLPEGHGDLIDRDALKKRTPMVIDYSAGGFGTDGSIRPVRGYGDWQIDQAPTIVPAEGGDSE